MIPGTLADAPEQLRLARANAWRSYLAADLAAHVFDVHGFTIIGFDLTTLESIHQREWPGCPVRFAA